MNSRIWRITLAVGLLAGVVVPPTTRPARAAPCGSLRNVVALANGVGVRTSLLAGTSDSGLYQSADGGRCWTRFASYPRGFSVGTVLIPPEYPKVLIAGGRFLTTNTQLKASLYRSEDAGKTWRSGNAGLPHTPILPMQLVASPRGTLVLAFDCPQEQIVFKPLCAEGLARSTDAGRVWHPVGPSMANTFGYALGVVALADGTFVAAVVPDAGKSALVLLRSSDDGRTWHVVGSILHHQPSDLATLFAVPWAAQQLLAGWGILYLVGSVSQSVDGGAHWPRQVAVKGVPVAIIGLSVTHTLLLSALSLLYRSTDGGQSWAQVPGGVGNDSPGIWALLAAPDGRTAYAGAAQGVYRSTDDGRTWQPTAG